jgi:rhamnose transport system ATP-binding protein
VDWNSRREQAQQLLQRIGAEISPEAEVRSLSMPEQQLVEIACALGAGARIVIMDEPTASLTQKDTHLLFAVVRELRKSGVGVIYISHRLEEIFQLADRVTVLRDGESVSTNKKPWMKSMKPRSSNSWSGAKSRRFIRRRKRAGRNRLSLKNLSCAAGGVKNVSLEIRAGEILGMAGLVGAGRTELARILFGITPADSGEIFLNGAQIKIHSPQDAVAHGIAYVPEDRRRHGVILEMPIAQNMTMAIHRRKFFRERGCVSARRSNWRWNSSATSA